MPHYDAIIIGAGKAGNPLSQKLADLLALVGFVYRKLTFASSVINFQVLRERNFAVSCGTAFGTFAVLYAASIEIGRVEPIRGDDESYLSIRTPDVLARIHAGDVAWEQMAPAAVAEIIKTEHLVGWRPVQATSTT